MESLLKSIAKKFPSFDAKPQSVSILTQRKTEFLKYLQPFYLLMHDIMEFKDHVTEILTIFDVNQIVLDLSINFDLTKGYLNLVVNMFTILHLIAKIEDRKGLLGVFNLAHELHHGAGQQSFPRLAQLVVDYEHPLRRLHEDFVPHAGVS